MVKKTPPKKAPTVSQEKPYDAKRDRERARNAAAAKTGRDIYPIPDVPPALAPCNKCGAEVEALGEPTRQPHDGTVIVRQRVRCTEPGCAQIAMQRDVLPAE